MVYRLVVLTTIIICAGVMALSTTGCATGSNPGDETCDADDCVQPPLRKAELEEHLVEHQERILSREDYKQRLPPPISDIIYGPLPRGHYRDGPPIADSGGADYDGDLNWHHVEFDDIDTTGADHRAMTGRDVSGAQCLFARQPNKLTAIFALLVVHRPGGGDHLYFGGPHQHVTRIDSGPLTNRRIRVDTDRGIRCVFRDTQNRHGAVIVPYYPDTGQDSDEPHYAVFEFNVATETYDTGLTTTVPRTTGLRGERKVEREVPLKRYPRPRIEFDGSYTGEYDAVMAADKFITSSDFRLRPEFVYPVMPYLSYLNTGNEEFCPLNVECKTPPKYLDKDIVPPLDAAEEALDAEATEESPDDDPGDAEIDDDADEG